MNADPVESCSVCRSALLKSVELQSPHFGFVRCSACGHVSAERHTQFDNNSLQRQFFGDEFAARHGALMAYYERINCGRAMRLLALSRPSAVLEVGPGSGSLMNFLARGGHRVTGLDISPSVALRIGSRFGLTVAIMPLEKYAAEMGSLYDAIIMRHVLEHFTDPSHAARAAYALLRPGGLLYVAVPNMDSWHSKWRGWAGFEPYHIQYFGRKSLAKCVQDAGLTILRMGSYESLTGWVNTTLRSIVTRGSIASVSGNASSHVGMMRSIFEIARLSVGLVSSPVRWIQSRLGRGEELFVVARKPTESI